MRKQRRHPRCAHRPSGDDHPARVVLAVRSRDVPAFHEYLQEIIQLSRLRLHEFLDVLLRSRERVGILCRPDGLRWKERTLGFRERGAPGVVAAVHEYHAYVVSWRQREELREYSWGVPATREFRKPSGETVHATEAHRCGTRTRAKSRPWCSLCCPPGWTNLRGCAGGWFVVCGIAWRMGAGEVARGMARCRGSWSTGSCRASPYNTACVRALASVRGTEVASVSWPACKLLHESRGAHLDILELYSVRVGSVFEGLRINQQSLDCVHWGSCSTPSRAGSARSEAMRDASGADS